METKDQEKMNTIPRWASSGKCVIKDDNIHPNLCSEYGTNHYNADTEIITTLC